MDLAPFKTIRAPHEAVHTLGHQALAAVDVGDMDEARDCVQEMQMQARLALQCLDEFKRDYPTTNHARQAA